MLQSGYGKPVDRSIPFQLDTATLSTADATGSTGDSEFEVKESVWLANHRTAWPCRVARSSHRRPATRSIPPPCSEK
jgi:hypothetical protein